MLLIASRTLRSLPWRCIATGTAPPHSVPEDVPKDTTKSVATPAETEPAAGPVTKSVAARTSDQSAA